MDFLEYFYVFNKSIFENYHTSSRYSTVQYVYYNFTNQPFMARTKKITKKPFYKQQLKTKKRETKRT